MSSGFAASSSAPLVRLCLLTASGVHLLAGAALMVRPEWAYEGAEGAPFAARALGALAIGFGMGYAASALAPQRHWAVSLAGLTANLLLTLAALAEQSWALAGAGAALASLLAAVLLQASDDHIREAGEAPPEPRERAMLRAMTQDGYSLLELSQLRPTLVVFLRHAGCTFCREAISDLARLRPELERLGTGLAFVTMSGEPEAWRFFERYGMADVARISDPSCRLYRAFALRRGRWRDLFGWTVWKRGFRAGILEGHGAGPLAGDGFRMPGVFLVHEGKVLRSYRHDGPADRPDYLRLANPESRAASAHAA